MEMKIREKLRPYLSKTLNCEAVIVDEVYDFPFYETRDEESCILLKCILMRNIKATTLNGEKIKLDHFWAFKEDFIEKGIFEQIKNKCENNNVKIFFTGEVVPYIKGYKNHERSKKIRDYKFSSIDNVEIYVMGSRNKEEIAPEKKLDFTNVKVLLGGTTLKNDKQISSLASDKKNKTKNKVKIISGYQTEEATIFHNSLIKYKRQSTISINNLESSIIKTVQLYLNYNNKNAFDNFSEEVKEKLYKEYSDELYYFFNRYTLAYDKLCDKSYQNISYLNSLSLISKYLKRTFEQIDNDLIPFTFEQVNDYHQNIKLMIKNFK